jgi:Ca2+-transporting ATPase
MRSSFVLPPLYLGFYQSFRPGATTKLQWVEGVAILVAVFLITLAQAINDFHQERRFRTLNAKVRPFRSFR